MRRESVNGSFDAVPKAHPSGFARGRPPWYNEHHRISFRKVSRQRGGFAG
ncbi:MAG: hypothetical protein JXA18_08050 [Chitinispirillaceae bacterium]|nr:hypothetical protein [Chitinispirillaceae bacterium]